MLRTITLRFGSYRGSPPLTFSPGPVTVFVGPNNSGKSLILRELELQTSIGEASEFHIVESVELMLHKDEVLKALRGDVLRDIADRRPTNFLYHDAQAPYRELLNSPRERISFSIEEFEEGFDAATGEYTGRFKRHFAAAYTLRLDGTTRLRLTEPQQANTELMGGTNPLMALLFNRSAREAIRRHTADALGSFFVVDPTALQKIRARMSQHAPLDEDEELSVSERGRAFHSAATPVEELSDGVKAFTGLLAAFFGAELKTVLIDEPEAFLHPPLARKLGRIITETAAARHASVLAATHSEHFLMGCIQSGYPVRIIRLTYDEGVATARMLDGMELQELMKNPLLRSTGLLSAIFHRGAVVCEGDIDRAFYEEVNFRLNAVGDGATDVLFSNAVGKQTIRQMIAPLRRMGIPAAAVVDLDILKEGDLRTLLTSANVPLPLVESWGDLKTRLLRAFSAASTDPKKGGIQALPQPESEAAVSLLKSGAEYGVFIVPVGEVENWLRSLGVTGKKTAWLTGVFEAMRSDPRDRQYLRPTESDVWNFVRAISDWIRNPLRKGMG